MSSADFSIPVHPVRESITKTNEDGDEQYLGGYIHGFTSFQLEPEEQDMSRDELDGAVQHVINQSRFTFGKTEDYYYKVYDEEQGGLVDVAIESNWVVLYVKESTTEEIVELISHDLVDYMGTITVLKQATFNNSKESETVSFTVSE